MNAACSNETFITKKRSVRATATHEQDRRSANGGADVQQEDCVQQQVGRRTFCRTVRRVTVSGEVKWLSHGAEVKASVNSA